MQLNDSQNKAVRHDTGPALVLAGPGSGKTRVITERVRYLISKCKVRPEHILVVTFTKAAAIEMKERYISSYGNAGVWFGTFHSIFFLILRSAYGYSASDIIKEDEKRKVISDAFGHFDFDNDSEKDIITDIINEISFVKSKRYDIDSYYSLKCPAEQFQYIYRQYDKYLRKKRKIDFDDMLVYTYELFAARKDILAGWQNRFRYILVDEFQDINSIQYDIVKMLAEPENNLFAVGDDDQSIYGFRGSDPSFMQKYTTDYRDAKKIILDVNYRCSGNIMNSAARLIKHNDVRLDKNIVPYKDAGYAVDIKGFETPADEYREVYKLVDRYINDGAGYNDIAVLYRTNMQPQPLISKFLEYNIPVKMKEGAPNIYDHFIAKDMFAYIKLALGYKDMKDFLRIMNKPKRYLSRDAVGMSEFDYDRIAAVYEDKPWMIDRIYQMQQDISDISAMNPLKGLRFIEKVIGYSDYLKEYAEYRNIPYENLSEVFEQLCTLASDYGKYTDWMDSVDEYVKWQNKGKTETVSGVNMMTLHGSKGLEFDNVIIIDVNEDIIPHKMSTADEQLEEERRMLYVGMTRAKKRLHLFYSKNRYNHPCMPSRFINEL